MIINKNTKIFLIIFSALLLVITFILIFYKNKNKDSTESHIIVESAQKIPELSDEDIYEQNYSNSTGLLLDDFYSNNGLKYEYIEDNSRKVKVSYVQISGLKNDVVQEGINNQIKERINKIVDSNNFKNNSDDSAYITSSVEANFSDVLSIKIFARFREDFNKCYGLNFRLDTGEKIKLNDLFIYNTPKRNIITQSAYRTFAMGYYTDEGIMNDFYYNIEDELVNFLKDYDAGKITEFSFSPLGIELYRDGKIVVIDMTKWYKYIAIYSKFVSSNNLYSGDDNVATKIPVLVKRPNSIVDLYEMVNDSCVIDVIIYSDDKFSSKELGVISNYKDRLTNELAPIKKEKGLYYSNYVKVTKSKEDDENVLVFDEYECFVHVDENDFANEVYSPIMLNERDINNIDYNESKVHLLDEELLHSATGQTIYSIRTGKEYVAEQIEDEENNEQDQEFHRETNDREQEEVEQQIQEAIRENETNSGSGRQEQSSDDREQEEPQREPQQQQSVPQTTPTTQTTTAPNNSNPQPGNITTQVIT